MNSVGEKSRFSFVKITDNNLSELEEIASETDFHLGPKSRKILFRKFPNHSYFIKHTNASEIAGFFTVHRLAENIYLRYQVFLRPKFRSKGGTLYELARQFYSFLFPNYTGNYFYNCNNKYLTRAVVRQPGEIIGPKFVNYEGLLKQELVKTVPCKNIDDRFQIKILKTAYDVQLIKDYDRKLQPFDRGEFLEEWCGDREEGITVLVTDAASNGQAVGYATTRKFPDMYWVSMAYADSVEIATHMLKTLFGAIPAETEVWMSVPAEQRLMINLFKHLGLRWYYADQRVYGKEAIVVDWGKVFVNHEAFLL